MVRRAQLKTSFTAPTEQLNYMLDLFAGYRECPPDVTTLYIGKFTSMGNLLFQNTGNLHSLDPYCGVPKQFVTLCSCDRFCARATRVSCLAAGCTVELICTTHQISIHYASRWGWNLGHRYQEGLNKSPKWSVWIRVSSCKEGNGVRRESGYFQPGFTESSG